MRFQFDSTDLRDAAATALSEAGLDPTTADDSALTVDVEGDDAARARQVVGLADPTAREQA